VGGVETDSDEGGERYIRNIGSRKSDNTLSCLISLQGGGEQAADKIVLKKGGN